MLLAFRRRLRALEAQKAAMDNRAPSIEELRSEARGEPVRPFVREVAARMRAFSMELETATVGFCCWPNAHKL